jgi:hypothetical protein
MNRHVLLGPDWLLDWMEVDANRDCVFDLPCYMNGQSIQWKDWTVHVEANPAAEAGIARHAIPDCSRLTATGCLHYGGGHSAAAVANTCESVGESGGAAISTTMLLLPSSKVTEVLAPGTADRPARKQAGWIHRQQGRSALFVSLHRIGSEPAELEWLEEGKLKIGTGDRAALCRLDPEHGLLLQIEDQFSSR